MRIVVLGDSLGLPRPHRINAYSPEELDLAVSYEQTYSSIIQKKLFEQYKGTFFEVINRSRRSCTIREIAREFSDYLFFYEPDVIILQVGIVDCWFRENRKQIVNIKEFEMHLNSIVKVLKSRPKCKLIIVGISPTSLKMDTRYPRLNTEIKKYNDIYISVVNHNEIFYVNLENFIEPSNLSEYILPDDHHLNPKGNELVAEEILKIINGLLLTRDGFTLFEKENLVEAFKYFKGSYESNPYYIDNLYNLLLMIFEKKDLNIYYNVVDFCKKNIKDRELLSLIDTISEEIFI